MRSGSHVQLAALRNRDLELQTTSPFSNHRSVERSTACFRRKNVLVLLGFQKFPFFCVTLYQLIIALNKIQFMTNINLFRHRGAILRESFGSEQYNPNKSFQEPYRPDCYEYNIKVLQYTKFIHIKLQCFDIKKYTTTVPGTWHVHN